MKTASYLSAAALLLLSPVNAVNSVVELDYSKYAGKKLGNGITQWLGVRYAAAPLGDLRFRAPQDPVQNNTVQDASDWGLPCIATGSDVSAIGKSMAEDCLFVNVFAPSNATENSKLPVFAFIQGGGFNKNSNAYVNGSGIIQAADMDMVVVTMNYRVGPYGFLEDNDQITPNIGLHDQRKALQWVQKYIIKFGGNPGRVMMGGASAGAASVAHHLSAYGGKDEGLFHAAAAESVSFASMLKVEESVYWYQNLALRLGCTGKTALNCLRSKSVEEIQVANYNIPGPGAAAAPLYMWTPVVDGDLVPDLTYNLFNEGKFIRVPVIMGDDTDGGTVFAPSNTTTLAESNAFLKNQFSFLNLEQLGVLNSLYPNKNTTCPTPGCYWRQVSDVYGHMRYMCSGIYISDAYARHGFANTWNYLYNVEDPTLVRDGYGVPHTIEVNAIFGPEYSGSDAPASYYDGEVNAPVTPVVQGYWSSFIRTHDPNTYRHSGSVKWEAWTQKGKQRIAFQTGGDTNMEKISADLQKKCSYFAQIGPSVRQ